MNVHRTPSLAGAALAAGALVCTVVAQQPVPRVIYSTFDASGTSHVPGTEPPAHFRWFDRPACDPNGTLIVFSADIDADPNFNQVVIVRGTATSAPGTLRVREGDPIQTTPTTLHNGPIRGPIAIRSDGSFAYVTNFPAGDAGVENDDALVRYDGATGLFSIAVRERDPVPGVSWPPLHPERIGTYLDSAQVLQDGNLAFVAGATWGLTDANEPNFAAKDEFVIQAGQVQLRAGVNVPTGFDADPSDPNRRWDHFDPDKYLLTPDGMTSLLRGDLTGDPNYNENILVYSGDVVLQQRRKFPPSETDPNYAVLNVKEIDLSPGGTPNPHWMAYGKYAVDYDDLHGYREPEFLARDGVRVAKTGDAAPCSTVSANEFLRDADWNETFFLTASNAGDAYIYGAFVGPSSGADPNQQSDVIVWAKSDAVARSVLRSGWRADIDGGGIDPAVDPKIVSF